MAITRWRPVSELQKHEDTDILIQNDDIICSMLACYEQQDALVVEFHVPGIILETLFLGVEGCTLMITGLIHDQYTDLACDFENFFELPITVKQQNINIDHVSDVLRIKFNK